MSSRIPITTAILQAFGVPKVYAEIYGPTFDEKVSSLSHITTTCRLTHFLAQILHESAYFTKTVENLFYTTPERIQAVFGTKRFPTISSALPYVRNPRGLANKVYSNRLGNGSEDSDDGWNYRGRGLIHTTFKDNYRPLCKFVGDNVLVEPDLVASKYALESALFYWNTHKRDGRTMDDMADRNDLVGISITIQGSSSTVRARSEMHDKVCRVLKGFC